MPRPTAQKAPINLSVLLVILYSALFKGLFSPSSIRINKGAQKDWAMQYSLTHTQAHTHTHTHTHTLSHTQALPRINTSFKIHGRPPNNTLSLSAAYMSVKFK